MNYIKVLISSLLCTTLWCNNLLGYTNEQNNTGLAKANFKALQNINTISDLIKHNIKSDPEFTVMEKYLTHPNLKSQNKLPTFKLTNNVIEYEFQNKSYKIEFSSDNEIVLNIAGKKNAIKLDQDFTIIEKQILGLFTNENFSYINLFIDSAQAQSIIEVIAIAAIVILVITGLIVGTNKAAKKNFEQLEKLKKVSIQSQETCNKLKSNSEPNGAAVADNEYEAFNKLSALHTELCTDLLLHLKKLSSEGVYHNPELIGNVKLSCDEFEKARKCIFNTLSNKSKINNSKRSAKDKSNYTYDIDQKVFERSIDK